MTTKIATGIENRLSLLYLSRHKWLRGRLRSSVRGVTTVSSVWFRWKWRRWLMTDSWIRETKSVVDIFQSFNVIFYAGSTIPVRKTNTVKPPMSDHPECGDLVVTYGRWLLTRIEPQWSFHLLLGRECTASNSKIWYGGSILSLRVLGIFWVV